MNTPKGGYMAGQLAQAPKTPRAPRITRSRVLAAIRAGRVLTATCEHCGRVFNAMVGGDLPAVAEFSVRHEPNDGHEPSVWSTGERIR